MAESEKKEKGENGEWFYNDEYRNQKGPVTPEKMGEFYKEGIVQNLTLCWKTGMSEWVQLRKIEELKPFIETFDDDIKDLEKLTNSTIGEKQDIRKKRKRKKKKKWKALKFLRLFVKKTNFLQQ
ncbi:hypothetical protein MHBO_002602 [Bonamia ostreae]|uniref:GYF domain-containing protein n=1 Tax=Bonamia ostreae TaxID=126728 RepID=A0ABV2AMV0_9EUKA